MLPSKFTRPDGFHQMPVQRCLWKVSLPGPWDQGVWLLWAG